MGDFLDDYLDGLSSGMQRYDPLPTGPYNGTKQKRQWHLLADGEREQAIFEARMREEEQSASAADAAAGADAGGSHISLARARARKLTQVVTPEQIQQAIQQAVTLITTIPDTPEQFIETADVNTAVTYGDLIDYTTGELNLEQIPDDVTVLPVLDTETLIQTDPVLTEPNSLVTQLDVAPLTTSQLLTAGIEVNETITTLAQDENVLVAFGVSPGYSFDDMGTGTGYLYYDSYVQNESGEWVGVGDPTGGYADVFGSIDVSTGLVYPMVALGGDYAIQFRMNMNNTGITLDGNSYGVSSVDYDPYFNNMYNQNSQHVYVWDGGMSDSNNPYLRQFFFEFYQAVTDTPEQVLQKVKHDYENFPTEIVYLDGTWGDYGWEGTTVDIMSEHTALGRTDVVTWSYSVIKIV
jgi:hypothetical protein